MDKKEKPKKERSKEYDPKVKFKGTFEDMIKVAIKPIHQKKKSDKTIVKGLGIQFEIERTKKELDRTDKILKERDKKKDDNNS